MVHGEGSKLRTSVKDHVPHIGFLMRRKSREMTPHHGKMMLEPARSKITSEGVLDYLIRIHTTNRLDDLLGIPLAACPLKLLFQLQAGLQEELGSKRSRKSKKGKSSSSSSDDSEKNQPDLQELALQVGLGNKQMQLKRTVIKYEDMDPDSQQQPANQILSRSNKRGNNKMDRCFTVLCFIECWVGIQGQYNIQVHCGRPPGLLLSGLQIAEISSERSLSSSL